MSPLFACVQELLQISIFSLSGYRGCSLLFARVGVKLVSEPRRLHWRDASAEFFKGPGTALSPGLIQIAAQTIFAVLSTRSGRAETAGATELTVLCVGSTFGVLGEKICPGGVTSPPTKTSGRTSGDVKAFSTVLRGPSIYLL